MTLSAPNIQVIGSSSWTIKTSGLDAKTTFTESKASNAIRSGENGDDGVSGEAGQSAGHVTILCDSLSGGRLHVEANGGKGGDGQDGGDGADGTNGKNGKDGEITDAPIEGIGLVNVGFRSSEDLKRSSDGEPGTPGTPGGNGGMGGGGGEGGQKGVVQFQIAQGRSNFKSEAHDGDDGQNGSSGKAGTGGSGGRNGLDRAKVFTPEYTRLGPIGLGFSGTWHWDCGDLELEEMRGGAGTVHGYRIRKRSDDKGNASKGKNGHEGQKCDQSQHKKATAKSQMSTVQSIWNCNQQHLQSEQSQQQISHLNEQINQQESDIRKTSSGIDHMVQKNLNIENQRSSWKEKRNETENMTRMTQEESNRVKSERSSVERAASQVKSQIDRYSDTIGFLNRGVEDDQQFLFETQKNLKNELDALDRISQQISQESTQMQTEQQRQETIQRISASLQDDILLKDDDDISSETGIY